MSQDKNATSNFNEILKAGKEQVIETKVDDIPAYLIPENMKLLTLEKLVDENRARPRHLKDTIKTLSIESFIDYVNRFADEHSTVFVNTETGHFVAVLDFHETASIPAHKHHLVTYTCPETKEWSSWLRNNNTKMEQEEFALFIEDNLNEILEPNGAQMLEIAASLKASNNVEFQSNVSLDNGQVQFQYKENINGQAGLTGQLEIPQKIKLAIRPFLNGAPYELEARFRYRVRQGGLMMWYTLIRPHLVKDDAVSGLLKTVREKLKAAKVIEAEYRT